MTSDAPPMVSARGYALDTSPATFGELRRSADAADDVTEMRKRLEHDGYLFLPGHLGRRNVLDVRHDLLRRLSTEGWTAPGSDPDDAIPNPGRSGMVPADVTNSVSSLMRLLYRGPMIEIYQKLFDGPVRHFDYTWLRAFAPGIASRPHMDSVFMNRGTLRLLTSWTPLSDIDRMLGGLAILENVHLMRDIIDDYGKRDVDQYCLDDDDAAEKSNKHGTTWDGAIADDPKQLAQQLNRRWLTTDYAAGDLLIFTIFTLHMGLDNNSDRLRLSCDTRYQPADEPADPRWVGVEPTAHSARSKRGTIC